MPGHARKRVFDKQFEVTSSRGQARLEAMQGRELDFIRTFWLLRFGMSFDLLKEQAAGLVPADRRRLMAYLVALEDAQTTAYRAKLREKIDDKDPAHWLTEEQLDERLGLGDSGQ